MVVLMVSYSGCRLSSPEYARETTCYGHGRAKCTRARHVRRRRVCGELEDSGHWSSVVQRRHIYERYRMHGRPRPLYIASHIVELGEKLGVTDLAYVYGTHGCPKSDFRTQNT